MDKKLFTASNIKSVLIIKLRAMGDTIITTATINELKQQHPKIKISCLVPKKWATLLENHPNIDQIYSWNSNDNIYHKFKLLRDIRKHKFDISMALHAGGTSSFINKLSGAKVRIAHSHSSKNKSLFSSFSIPHQGETMPIIERDFNVLKSLNINPQGKKSTSIYLTNFEKSQGEVIWKKRGLQSPCLAMGIGASRPSKVWPKENFLKISKMWKQKTGGDTLVFSGPNEAHLTHEFPSNQIISGGNLRINASLLQRCKIFIGNDSGPKHLAVSLNPPTLTLFGPENPFEWHPYNTKNHPFLFIEEMPCRKTTKSKSTVNWCSVNECIEHKHKCMKNIGVNEVIQSLEKLLP